MTTPNYHIKLEYRGLPVYFAMRGSEWTSGGFQISDESWPSGNESFCAWYERDATDDEAGVIISGTCQPTEQLALDSLSRVLRSLESVRPRVRLSDAREDAKR